MDFSDIDWMDVFLVLIVLLCVGLIGGVIYVAYLHQTGIQEGIVYDKDFNPAGCMTTYMSISNGKTTTLMPMTTCHGDTYTLKIQDDEARNWFEVPQVVYEGAKIGDFYSAKCDCIQ